MPDQLTAAGGLVAPVSERFTFRRKDFYIHLSKAQRVGLFAERFRRLRVWLCWDTGWGFPLEGSVPRSMRTCLPLFTAHRGGIQFFVPPSEFDVSE